jgi:hypothetical protein
MDFRLRVPRIIEHILNAFQGGGASESVILLQNFCGVLARVINVFGGRLGHAFKGIEEIQIPAYILYLEKGLGGCRHASSLPNSAFNHGPLDVTGTHVPHRLNESVDSLRARHGPGTDFPDDVGLLIA